MSNLTHATIPSHPHILLVRVSKNWGWRTRKLKLEENETRLDAKLAGGKIFYGNVIWPKITKGDKMNEFKREVGLQAQDKRQN